MAPRQLMLKGTLDMLVLQVLVAGPLHGYAITRRIQDLTDEVLRIEEGSMYPALYRMERRGWIESEWTTSDKNRRARVYTLTAAGRKQLTAQAAEWTRFSRAVGKVMPA